MADNFQGLLDTLFLTRQSPISGLLSPEEQERLKTQQLIGTGLGLATGLASNWNKGVAGAALGGFTGAVGGRQAPIDAATKNFMTTTELSKMMQDIQKGGLDIKALQGQDIARQAKVNQMRTLGYNDTDIANFLLAEKDFIGAELKSNVKFRPLPEIDKQDLSIMQELGIDFKNPSAQDMADVRIAKDAINFSSTERAKLAVPRAEFQAKQTIIPLDKLPSPDAIVAQIKADRIKRSAAQNVPQANQVVNQPQVATPAQTNVAPVTQPQVTQQTQPPAVNTTKVPQTNVSANPTPAAKTTSTIPFVNRQDVSAVTRQQLKDNQSEIQKRLTDSFTSLNNFEKTVYDIITDKDFDNAFGPLATKRAGIEGTAAFKVNNLIASTEGAALVSELKKLKSLSPSGAAGTGNLSEKEGDRIIASLNKLKLGLPVEEGKRVVVELLQTIQAAKANLNQGYANDYGNDFEFPKSEFLPLETKVKTDKGEIKVYSGANPYIKKRFPAKASGLDPNAQYYIMNNELYYF
jgi:hypothetical protein